MFWLGGGSGGGKSTTARRLADRHGLTLYATDDAMADHARRSGADVAPALHAFKAMDMDERWMRRSPQDMLDGFHWFRGEGFDLILSDLAALPRDRPIIAEGFRLLPRLVAPCLTDRRRAVFLLPTPAFRRAAFQARGTLWTIARRTSDPERALSNILERDRLFTIRVAEGAGRERLTTIPVGPGTTEDALAERVEAVLGLPPRG